MSDYIERYWRDATPEDAIKEPPMVARFRNEDAEDWEYDLLVGWDRTDQCHWRSELDAFEQCQVYDAPNPGEGWRLVDTDKDKLRMGDEALLDTDDSRSKWETLVGNEILSKRCVIRRRIEPPKPKYEPFQWEDREQLRGRWIVDTQGDEHCIVRFEMYLEMFCINNAIAEEVLQEWTFLDTGEPVGRRVE